jgi:CheY-like chemotaxis protein
MSAGTWRDDIWRSWREAEPRAPQSRSHVLILDDHAPSREICAGYCDLFDHTSESIGAAGEAVAALKRADFGVVVLSVHADAWDALEVIPAIRALPGPAGATPIIGLTGVGRSHEAQRWLAAGLIAVLPKPVTAARLFAALAAALDDDGAEFRSWAPAR